MRPPRPVRLALVAVAALAAASVAAAGEQGASGEAASGAEAPSGARPPLDSAWILSVGTGAGGIAEIADAESFFVSAMAGTESTRTSRLDLNLRLGRELSRWLSAGLSYTYFAWSRVYTSGGAAVGDVDYALHALLADATLRWIRTEHVELYSGLALGFATVGANGTEYGAPYSTRGSGLAFQLRLLGLSVGNARLRAFGELGFGFESLVLAGLSVRL